MVWGEGGAPGWEVGSGLVGGVQGRGARVGWRGVRGRGSRGQRVEWGGRPPPSDLTTQAVGQPGPGDKALRDCSRQTGSRLGSRSSSVGMVLERATFYRLDSRRAIAVRGVGV